MSLVLKASGTTKLVPDGSNLIIQQDNIASFKLCPGKIIINANYIYCDSYVFKKDTVIPVLSAYFKGAGTANINLSSKSHTVNGITAGSVKYTDYVAALVKVLKLSGITATHYWSACKSSVTTASVLTKEQNACLNGTVFTSSWYSNTNKAPTVVKSSTAMTSTAGTPIGVGLTTSPGYSIKQSGATSNVYYAMGVKLTWAL